MSSSGQTPVTQQTTQTKDPWSAAQPYLQQTMAGAQDLYTNNTGYLPYGDNTTAGWTDPMTTSYGNTLALAQNEPYGSTGLSNARGLLSDLTANQGLSDPLSSMASTLSTQQNPYLQDTINQQVGKVNSAFSGAGRYGSGMHDAAIAQAIAPTLQADYMQRQGMAADIYGQGLQRAGQAAQLTPTLDEARYANAAH